MIDYNGQESTESTKINKRSLKLFENDFTIYIINKIILKEKTHFYIAHYHG